MKQKKLDIIGGGGQAKVVLAAAQESGWKISAVWDRDPQKVDKEIAGIPIKNESNLQKENTEYALVALGENRPRHQLVEKFNELNWATVIHPHSWVHESVLIGEGSVICGGAVIQPGAVIGKHAVVNTGATVDHDCEIGDFVHLAPGAHVAGYCTIGDGCFLGVGSSVIDHVTIGNWSTVGAGAAVVDDLPERCLAVGVPAKVIRSDYV